MEAARVAAVCSYDVLDGSPNPQLDTLCRAAATALNAPVAFISFIDTSQQWIKARVGSDLQAVPRYLSFCHHTIHERSGVLIVPDLLVDPRFSVHPWVQDGPQYRFYAGVVIVDPGEYRIGVISIMDTAPRPRETAATTVLQHLSADVMDVLLTPRVASDELAETPEVPDPASQQRSIRGWLGVRTERTAYPPVHGPGGLVLLSIARASPAERAGLAVGDVLIAIANHPTLDAGDISLALSVQRIGDVVPVQIWRAGRVVSRSIQVEAMPRARRTKRRA